MEMTLALANYPITMFPNLESWKAHTQRWVHEAIVKGAQVLVFPEYGSMELTSLFSEEMQKDLHGQIIAMQELRSVFLGTYHALSRENNCVIVAPSFPVLTNERVVNRVYVFGPRGEGWQDKWNMTRFEAEEWNIQAPEKRTLTVFESSFGPFGIQICYDIEFPGAGALLVKAGCEIILAPSCTETIRGATRVHIGARARAMEQQVYVGVSQTCNNATWSPAVDINYGYAAIYSTPDKLFPELGIITEGKHQHEGWTIQSLDLSKITEIRNTGQVFNHRDYQKHEAILDCEVVKVKV